MAKVKDLIGKLDGHSATPHYMQLADMVLHAWVSGNLVAGELLPSLHELCTALEVSRGTVERAYGLLRELGVVSSHQGKGYFIIGDRGETLLERLRDSR